MATHRQPASGAVRLSAAHAPEWAASCNWPIYRRLGWLVAYYRPDEVAVAGPTEVYARPDRLIGFHLCPGCGCTSHWAPLEEARERELSDEIHAMLDNRAA